MKIEHNGKLGEKVSFRRLDKKIAKALKKAVPEAVKVTLQGDTHHGFAAIAHGEDEAGKFRYLATVQVNVMRDVTVRCFCGKRCAEEMGNLIMAGDMDGLAAMGKAA